MFDFLDDPTAGGLNMGGSGQGGEFESFMKMFGQGQSFLGMSNPAVAGVSTGLGMIGNFLQGETFQEKQAKKVAGLAENRLGQSVLNPDQYLSDFMRVFQERQNTIGQNVDEQFGLDTGVGASEMFKQTEPFLAQFMMQARQRNDELTASNDNMLLQLMRG